MPSSFISIDGTLTSNITILLGTDQRLHYSCVHERYFTCIKFDNEHSVMIYYVLDILLNNGRRVRRLIVTVAK
jgi:hypothetical protein